MIQHPYFILLILSISIHWEGAFPIMPWGKRQRGMLIFEQQLSRTILNCKFEWKKIPKLSQMRRLDPEHISRLSHLTAWHNGMRGNYMWEMDSPQSIRETSKEQECQKALIPLWPLIIGCGAFPLTDLSREIFSVPNSKILLFTIKLLCIQVYCVTWLYQIKA